MGASWPQVKLGEMLHPTDEWEEIRPDKTYRQVTVRLWGKGVVLRGEVPGTSIAAKKQRVVREGQFIISKIDARHGASGRVPSDLHGAVVSNDFPTFQIDESRLNSDFFDWYSTTSSFIHICKQASEGSTNRVRLKEDRFLALTIPVPLPDEQRRIVAWLDGVKARVEEVTRLRSMIHEDLTALAQSLHDSFSENVERPLADFIDLDETRIPVKPENSYPQVGVRGFAGGLFKKEALPGTDTSYKHFNRLSDGLLLVSQPKGWEGAVAVCSSDFEGWFASPEYRTFRCKPGKLNPRYLAGLLPTVWFQSELAGLTRGQGARRQRLRPEMLLAMPVRMPNLERQNKALEIIQRADEIQRQKTPIETSLDALLPAMLHRVFNGACGSPG